jgi:hypothetical protein
MAVLMLASDRNFARIAQNYVAAVAVAACRGRQRSRKLPALIQPSRNIFGFRFKIFESYSICEKLRLQMRSSLDLPMRVEQHASTKFRLQERIGLTSARTRFCVSYKPSD